MEFKNLKGGTYKLSLAKYMKQRQNCSGLHKIAREILYQDYGNFTILEEVKIQTRPLTRQDLYLDFLILELNRAYEVQGEQHYKFSPHFHKSKMDFIEQRKRDRYKKEWCEINKITLIELGYDCTDDWQRKIRED